MSEEPKKSGIARFFELGPAWVTSVTGLIVALAAAGFFAGRVSAATPKPSPTVTITAPAPGSAPASPGSGSGAGSVSTAGNGTLLGSYNVKIPPGFTVPLDASAPTQGQFIQGSSSLGDVLYNAGALLPEGTNDKMLAVPSGAAPSYQSCTADTVFTNSASGTAGTSFCLIEAGKMIGATVTAVSPTNAYAVLHVNVWKHVS